MRFFARALTAFGLCTALIASGCSKENNISMEGADVGQECQATSDCGPSAVCSLGICRVGCTNDAECPQETLCVGDQPPYGCTTLDEGACSSANPCPAGLACGIDGRCRNECAANEDCPRNEQECVAGTCVSHSEPDADETWFACREGEEACINSEDVDGQSFADAIAQATVPENAGGACEMEGCELSDPDCLRNVYAPSGGYSPRNEGSVHAMCNVTGPGWQVLADCGSWAYCVGALSATQFGGLNSDYTCSSAANPPLKSETCTDEWYGDPECEAQYEAGTNDPICRDGVLGNCEAPTWRAEFPEEPCP